MAAKLASLALKLQAAEAAELDLVQISMATHRVKLWTLAKSFTKRKAKSRSQKRQHQVQIKEIKFRPGTDEGDYQIKLKSLKRFLEDGDKAKITLRFAVARWRTKSLAWT